MRILVKLDYKKILYLEQEQVVSQLSANSKCRQLVNGKRCNTPIVQFTSLTPKVCTSCAIRLATDPKQRELREKKKTKELKKKSEPLSTFKKLARYWFQRWIRLRDRNKPCACCGESIGDDIRTYHAGHCFKAEIYSGLLFNEDNVNGQRIYCNKYRGGNEGQYISRLPLILGEVKANELIDLAEKCKHVKVKRTREDYLLIIEEYKKRCKEIENDSR